MMGLQVKPPQSLDDIVDSDLSSDDLVRLTLRGSFTQSLFIWRFSTWSWEVHPDFMPNSIQSFLAQIHNIKTGWTAVHVKSAIVGQPARINFDGLFPMATDPVERIDVCHSREAFHDNVVLRR